MVLWKTLGFLLHIIWLNVIYCSNCNDLDFTKTNVVLFFAKPDHDIEDKVDDAGISFLKFPITGSMETSIPLEYKKLLTIKRDDSDCKDVFNKCMNNLMQWAISVKHMVTASISTLDSKAMSSSVFGKKSVVHVNNYPENENYNKLKYNVDQPQEKSKSENTIIVKPQLTRYTEAQVDIDPFEIARDKEYFGQLPFKRRLESYKGAPVLKFEGLHNEIPIISAFNPHNLYEKKMEDELDSELAEEYYKKVKPDVHVMQLRTLKTEGNLENIFGTPQEHLNTNNNKKEQRSDVKIIENKGNDNEAVLDQNKDADAFLNMFGLFSKLRDTFLESFLNPGVKRSQFTEENMIDTTVLGKSEDKPMFNLVKSTLESIHNEVNSRYSENPGFLMVVIGGNLSEVANPFSDLVQSVKYVIENTKNDTLVLVTAACPDRAEGRERVKRKFPYYARGQNSENLANSRNMYEIFENIRNSIAKVPSKAKSAFKRKKQPKTNFRDVDYFNNKYLRLTEDNILVGRDRRARSSALNTFSKFINYIFITTLLVLLF